jgi:hypothetical protein
MIQELRNLFLTYFNNGYTAVNEDLSRAITKKMPGQRPRHGSKLFA